MKTKLQPLKSIKEQEPCLKVQQKYIQHHSCKGEEQIQNMNMGAIEKKNSSFVDHIKLLCKMHH
jgi:hypothetical protein